MESGRNMIDKDGNTYVVFREVDDPEGWENGNDQFIQGGLYFRRVSSGSQSIDKQELFWNINGQEVCDHDGILSILLEENILFCNSRKYVELDGTTCGPTVVVFMCCNDIFYYAADAEDITFDELPELYKLYEKDKKWGSVKWVCMKRNARPLAHIIKHMKKDGAWDDSMEQLPKRDKV